MSDLQRYLAQQREESPTFVANYERSLLQAKAECAFAAQLEANGIDCEEYRRVFNLSVHEFNVLAHFVYKVNDEEPPQEPLRQVFNTVLRLLKAVSQAEQDARSTFLGPPALDLSEDTKLLEPAR